jgi:hypothetical protein
MTELFIQDEAELPWRGGWVLIFGCADSPAQIALREERGGVKLRCDRGSLAIELNWDLEGGAVEIECRSAASSATESER